MKRFKSFDVVTVIFLRDTKIIDAENICGMVKYVDYARQTADVLLDETVARGSNKPTTIPMAELAVIIGSDIIMPGEPIPFEFRKEKKKPVIGNCHICDARVPVYVPWQVTALCENCTQDIIESSLPVI